MREIVLDTETTGLNTGNGDRVIEIGCVEIINRIRTGKIFHYYLNVPKESSPEALNIHGLTKEFLSDKPKFAEISQEFVDFLSDSPLVIHNAKFDMRFLNNEFDIHNMSLISNQIIDSLTIARQKFPGSPVSLDALCKRFNIDASKRFKHGALLDAELLADVYLELTGGRQINLDLVKDAKNKIEEQNIIIDFPKRNFQISSEEEIEHKKMLEALPNNLWQAS